MIANHLAAAIANSRAIEEFDLLKKRLEQENEYLREEVQRAAEFGDLIGRAPALQAVTRQIELVAPTNAAVLILGESGTGKEVVAREINRHSFRAERPLIKVNCAAIPRELYESEFFGHAKGAFTGALRDRVGRFELADGDTEQELRLFEANNIRAALSECNGKVYGANGAAALPGLKPTTLNSRIKVLGIRNV